MDSLTELEIELIAACQENPAEALPVVDGNQDWLATVQGFLRKIASLPSGPALLVNAPDGVRHVPLAKATLTLGRSSQCTVRLPYRFVSREHCRLRLEGEQWFMEDLRSTNGTLVNGVEQKRALLVSGDILQVGEALILFLPAEREGAHAPRE